MTTQAFWSGKRVFMTGHTGFKGSWLSLWLQQWGAELTGYALEAPTTPSLYELANVSKNMRSIIGDIRDADTLSSAMRQAKPDIVLHLAAQPIVRQSYVDPTETYSTNVMGLVNLFEAVRAAGCVQVCVNVTSDKCYENMEWPYGYRENDAMGGRDPYSSSKACSELITNAYRRSYFAHSGVALASARAGNVIGGGDWAADRLIPDILRAFEVGLPVLIRHPAAIRPWQHVLEPLSGYLKLAERLSNKDAADTYAEGWNFGPSLDDRRSVHWIVERMIQLWGQGASWRKDDALGPHEAQSLTLDCQKSCRELDWSPRWTISKTIEQIMLWHKAFLAGEDMHDFSLAQINRYCADKISGEIR